MSSTDFEKLNIILAARDREFARAMDRNTRRIERFERRAQKSLSKTSRHFDLLGSAAKRLGPLLAGLGGAAVLGRARRTLSTLDDIGKTADKLGLTTDALQELRAAAESAGVGQNTLDMALQRFGRRVAEARKGTGEAKAALAEMGIALEDAAGNAMPLEGMLAQVADRMAGVASQTDRNRLAMKLFDSEGVAMVNLLREGADGMARMREDARALGIVVDENLIRSAEDAQTQLDLMSRVIDAQLNSALASMAPLLVGGATLLADVARGARAAIDWVGGLGGAQSDLQIATENLVLALGDEITQSQLLEVALSNGITLSTSAARAKLQEAMGRHENVKAIIAEHRALALGSTEWADLTAEIADAQNTLNATGFPARDIAVGPRADAFEQQQLRLAGLISRRQELLKVDAEMDAQLKRTGENIAKLEAGLASSAGGIVKIGGGTPVAPIENSPKKTGTGGGGGVKSEIPALSDYAAVVDKVNSALGRTLTTGNDFGGVLAGITELYEAGQISAEEYEAALGAVEDRFGETMRAAENFEQSAEDAMASVITGAKGAKAALADLLAQWAQLAAKSAVKGLFGGVFGGIAGIFSGDLKVSGAAAAAPSFDGGGYTGSGARSGGIDGRGGFPAILHPNETVIDHNRPRGASGGAAGVSINISVAGARGNAEISDMVEQGVLRGLQQYDRAVLPRRVSQINRDPRKVS